MVHPASHRVSRALWYSGTGLNHLIFIYGSITLYAGPFQNLRLTSMVYVGATTPEEQAPLVWTGPVRSPLLGESQLISIPLGTEMFHFPRFALTTYEFSCQ